MDKTLVLLGSGEFTSQIVPVDKYIIGHIAKKTLKNIKVVIVPTAAGLEPDASKWNKDGIAHFNRLKCQAIGLEIYNKKQANLKTNLRPFNNSSLIYISGGDPGYLLNCLNKTLLFENILNKYQNNTILAGSSAGAMVLGKFCLANPYQFLKGEKPKWKKGLGLIDYSIIAHFDVLIKDYPDAFEKLLNESDKKITNKLLAIDENTALFINNRQTKVLGRGRVIVFKKGQKIVLDNKNVYNIGIV